MSRLWNSRFLVAGLCSTQIEFCAEGGYNLPQNGSAGCAGTCSDTANFSKRILNDGSWADVNYTDRTGAKWLAMLHMVQQDPVIVFCLKTDQS
jgi:hypothetical protein